MAEIASEITTTPGRHNIARYPAGDEGRKTLVDIYLDASVLVPLVIEETGSPRAWAIVEQHAHLWTSEFAAAEVASALSRLVRTSRLGGDAAAIALTDFATWRLETTSDAHIETADIRVAHSFVRRFETQLRVPDALHLALAHRLDATFATFDAGAARAASLLDIATVT